jgi:predicted CXXCH cytochrome family protein
MKPWKVVLFTILALALGAALTAAIVIHLGFTANAEPSALESRVARAIRNFSIPSAAKSETNPIAATTENSVAARDTFLARCSVCHGSLGDGRSATGANLYPRAPDLRSAQTQSLTDGELHYIIQNGVRLTGMPAWGSPHQESGADAWKLVAYIRTFRRPSTSELDAQQQFRNSAHYVGSLACRQCHAEIYDRWKKTPMANVVRDPREHPDAILPDLATNDVSKFNASQVAFVYGSLWKQRYFTQVGDDYVPLSVQWEVRNHKWSKYFAGAGTDWWTAHYPPDNMQRPTGPLCDGCHSVDYDIHTKKVAEWNVGCERCHGAGSEHAAHPTRTNILNPALLDSFAANDTCIQCHSQGQPLSNPIEGKYYDWPVGYLVGFQLRDFWKLESHALGETNFYYFADGTAHKNRMQGNDFAQSVMYRHGVTCSSCHDAHGTGNYAQLRKPAATLCLDCHAPMSANGPREATLELHTHHKPGSAGGDCVACHMPAIETEGPPNTFVHAHTFRFITPAVTAAYKIPNPCTSCHADKTNDWAATALGSWPNVSAWRLASANP